MLPTIFKCVKRAVGILIAVQRKVLTDILVTVVEKEIHDWLIKSRRLAALFIRTLTLTLRSWGGKETQGCYKTVFLIIE